MAFSSWPAHNTSVCMAWAMRAQKNIANGRTEKTTQFEQFESCWIMNVSEHEAVDDWQTRKIFTRSARWKITLQNKIDNEILWSLGTNTQHTALTLTQSALTAVEFYLLIIFPPVMIDCLVERTDEHWRSKIQFRIGETMINGSSYSLHAMRIRYAALDTR